MRKRYIQSAENGVGQTQKQGNTAANSTLPNNQPSRRTTAATRPFLTKKKGDTVTDAAVIMQTYLNSATNRKPTVL